MTQIIRKTLAQPFLVTALVSAFGGVLWAEPPAGYPPETIVMNGEWLAAAKTGLEDGDTSLQPALNRLVEEADQAMTGGPFSVMSKSVLPPSGDRHDYMSFGPYWWPNADTEDGLPYVRRDGEVNPESKGDRSDTTNMGRMTTAVNRLALAWYFTGQRKYAEQATLLLHTWFLNPETLMNPNLDFGQAIPGIVQGRGIGIIDTSRLIKITDAAILLQTSRYWTDDDHAALTAWFSDFLVWLQTSPNGLDESRTRNHHSTWYDAQVATFALFVGEDAIARKTLLAAGPKRIATQIEPDGSQPRELARTRTLSYSLYNLQGFFTLGRLGEHVDIDLWNFPSGDSPILQSALDFITPHADPDEPWAHQQITEFRRYRLMPLLRQGFIVYGKSRYLDAIEFLPEETRRSDRSLLLFRIDDLAAQH